MDVIRTEDRAAGRLQDASATVTTVTQTDRATAHPQPIADRATCRPTAGAAETCARSCRRPPSAHLRLPGHAALEPGEAVDRALPPVLRGVPVLRARARSRCDLDGETAPLRAGRGLLIPIGVRHRLRNVGDEQARMVFHLGPLAPRPELGHVDTEALPDAPAGRPA